MFAGAGAAAALAPVGAVLASVHRASAATEQLHLGRILFTYPSVNAAAWILLGLALVGTAAIAAGLRSAFACRAEYRRFLARVPVVGRLGGRSGVHLVADPRPQAFCAGYLRPRVYVSQGAVDLLSEAELEAVLAHERHHLHVRDPLRIASGRILGQALFFVPAVRAMFGRYGEEAELNADGAAVREGPGGRAALAAALLAFDGAGAGISPERVDALLGTRRAWRCPRATVTASLISLVGVAAVTWGMSQAASATATFNLPFLSSQPCLAVLALGPLLGSVAVLRHRTAARRRRGLTPPCEASASASAGAMRKTPLRPGRGERTASPRRAIRT